MGGRRCSPCPPSTIGRSPRRWPRSASGSRHSTEGRLVPLGGRQEPSGGVSVRAYVLSIRGGQCFALGSGHLVGFGSGHQGVTSALGGSPLLQELGGSRPLDHHVRRLGVAGELGPAAKPGRDSYESKTG